MTEPSPERRRTISARQHYYDLTVVYCLILIVLTMVVPWPPDWSFRRVGIDVIGVVLLVQAGISFMRARRTRAQERRDVR